MKKVLCALGVLAVFAAGLVIAQEAGKEQPAPAAPELKVEQAVIAKDVQNREPVEPGEKFAADVGKVYCFTKISGAKGETEIKHVWYLGDKMMGEVPLKLNGSPWRTWSIKTIDKSMTGAWKVEVKDATGNLLSTVNFTIE